MPSFGRYKTVRELYRIGFVVLYSGRAEDSPEEKFAVKVFQPSALLLEKERAKAESDLFLSSASVQQKVSASGAQHWAPIFEQGLSPDGAFYVTNKYDHSLQQLIDGRVKLTAQALHAIIESAAKGLIELKQACSRPHGNLKAANVLITGAADFSQNKVVLTDPLPDEQIDTEVHWDTDLRAIAEFIYQFVMHRPSPVSSGWQAPQTEEWAKLGRQADDWRNLCNRLLNASTKPGAMTIETLLEELAKLKGTKPIPTHRYILAAGLIVAVGAIIWWSFFRKPPQPPEVNDWGKLCSEYIDLVEDLHMALGVTKDSPLATRWRKDPDLSKILDKIKKDASYPYRFIEPGKTVNELKDIKTKEKLQQLGVDTDATKRAGKAVEFIKNFFDPNDGNAWPLLHLINEDANNYSGRGWQRPAAYLQNFVDAVKPGPGNKTIADNVGKLLELERQGITKNIRDYVANIAKYQKTITGLGDPVLAKFDDFVNKEAALGLGEAGEESLSKLSKNLQEINTLAGDLAVSIGDDWQKAIDREDFNKDHGKDSVGILTRETFTDRLKIIQDYRYLKVDPLGEIDGLVREIERYMKEGQISNPKEAAECKRKLDDLRPKIDDVRLIKGIAKNEEKITDLKKQYKPTLENLRDMALSLTEKPSKYVKRMEQEELSTAKSDKVKEKWTMVKKALLQNYPLRKIEQYPELYSELRQKMNDADNNLIALDKELQTQLPLQVGTEMGEEDWQRRLGKIYEQEREKRINSIVEKIPLTNAVPDISEAEFKKYWVGQYSEFTQWRENLAGIVGDFNAIAGGLELYYSLDDNLPQVNKSISSLWQTCKDKDILKDRRIKDGLNELISRIEKLGEVKGSDNRQNLIATAIDSRSRPEAVYAAWERLGAFSDPNWPNKAEEWGNDKKIQEKLKVQFEAIQKRNQSRGDELLKMLSAAGIEREKVYLMANIGRYREDVAKNSSQDQMLLRFDKFQPYGSDSDLSEIKDFEAIAGKLAEFVTSDDWRSKKFRMDLLPARPQTVVSIKTFEGWLNEIKEYRIIEPDPRNDKQFRWDETRKYVRKELDSTPTAEDSDKLRADFEKVEPDIDKMLKLPAIEKNRGEISKCEDYWKQLLDIQNKLKPEYCRYLQLKDGQVILDPKAGLDGFEPVAKNDDDTFAPVKVTGWKEIEKIKTVFFRSTDKGDAGNMGWPKYIRSAKDPSVILAFVPAGRDNPEPFYMDRREISNAQYCLFLNDPDIGAKDSGKLDRGADFVDRGGRKLIIWASDDYPPCAIKSGKSKGDFVVNKPNEDAPVVWVTFGGANSYAEWLGGRLPTASQHRYACLANTGTKYPYAHVRAAAWKREAEKYNSEINVLVPSDEVHCPIGAVDKEVLDKDKPLDINNFAYKEDGYNSAWPLATTSRPNAKPNDWGLYDMIGNVWEWCRRDENITQTVICGGSCLAPLEYAAPDSKYDFKGGQACDVGFRVIVPAK